MNRFKSSIQQVQDAEISGLPRKHDNVTRKRSRKCDHAILAIAFFMAALATTAGYLYDFDIAKIYSESNLDISSGLSLSSNNNKDQTKSYKDKLYAHLHVAKTGGTSLFYELAHFYQNVCGKKSIFPKILLRRILNSLRLMKGTNIN